MTLPLKKTDLEELVRRIVPTKKEFVIGLGGGIAGYLIGKYAFCLEGGMNDFSTFMGSFLALYYNYLQKDDEGSGPKDKYK